MMETNAVTESDRYKYLLYRQLKRNISMANETDRIYTSNFFSQLFSDLTVTEESYNKFVAAMDENFKLIGDKGIYACENIPSDLIDSGALLLADAFAAIGVDLTISATYNNYYKDAIFVKPDGTIMVYTVYGGSTSAGSNYFYLNCKSRTEYNYAKLTASCYNFKNTTDRDVLNWSPRLAGRSTYWNYDDDSKTMTITGTGALHTTDTDYLYCLGDPHTLIIGSNVTEIQAGAIDSCYRRVIFLHSADSELVLADGIFNTTDIYDVDIYCDNKVILNTTIPANVGVHWHSLSDWDGNESEPNHYGLTYNGVFLPNINSDNSFYSIGLSVSGKYILSPISYPYTISSSSGNGYSSSFGTYYEFEPDRWYWVKSSSEVNSPIWSNYRRTDSDGTISFEPTAPTKDGVPLTYSKRTYYNAKNLPLFPEYDDSTYKYALISYEDEKYYLYLSSAAPSAYSNSYYYVSSGSRTYATFKISGKVMIYSVNGSEDNEWTYVSTSSSYSKTISTTNIKWCNTVLTYTYVYVPKSGSSSTSTQTLISLAGTNPANIYEYTGGEVSEIIKDQAVTITPSNWVIFESNDAITLSVVNRTRNWDGTIYYSTDSTNWYEWGGETVLESEDHDGTHHLYMCGTGNTKLTGFAACWGWKLEGDNIYCKGDLASLLDYEKLALGEQIDTAEHCFSHIFRESTGLVGVSAISANTLGDYSCYFMFANCINLTDAPTLSANTLADHSYAYMFRGCASLTTAPVISDATLASYCCYRMFSDCISLTQAPELSATALSEYCYYCMFYGCTSLAIAPALPATTLADYCYSNMFYGCTGLVVPPELPAATMTKYCYSSMFYGCTGLVVPPELPATTLAEYCYYYMFYGCTGLVVPPELPAATMTKYCYSRMFYGCTGLVVPPELPATTLAEYCYYYMFYECKSIKLSATQTDEYTQSYRVPTSGTGTAGTNSLYYMFGSTGGTFTGTPTINTTYYMVPYVPEEEPVEPEDPEEPEEPEEEYIALDSAITFRAAEAFTLATANSSQNWDGTLEYSTDGESWSIWTGKTILSSAGDDKQYLFLRGSGNTYLTGDTDEEMRWVLTGSDIQCVGNIEYLLDYETVDAGDHPEMIEYALAYLFYECSAITTAPELSAETLTEGCYMCMFLGCTNLTQAPELPALTMEMESYGSMFEGCRSLTTAPDLPATKMAMYCYDSMFAGCSGLLTPPQISATTLATYCCRYMFDACTNLTAPAELPATTLKSYCYNSMFRNCTSIKLSTTEDDTYTQAYRIPTEGAGTTATNALKDMFTGTGGTFTGTPTINTIYYLEVRVV